MGPYFSLGDYTRKDPDRGGMNSALKVSHRIPVYLSGVLTHEVKPKSFRMTANGKIIDSRILKIRGDYKAPEFSGIQYEE